MVLDRRREPEVIPQYSLTGDLLSFLRCGLQYRYHNGSALPPSRPVQLWFGEFIHGVMEAAFRIWRGGAPPPAFPWPFNPTPFRGVPPAGRANNDIGAIADLVEIGLRAQGKNPRSQVVRDSAMRRCVLAVNELGPNLFPLISAAEERVIGTRNLPVPAAGAPAPRARMYELHGIIDVVTDVELTGAPHANALKQAIQEGNPGLAGRYEIIVDYKGSRRPATSHPYWTQGDWQVQTYAWLRTQQPRSLPVAAGMLIYVNELAMSGEDLTDLKHEIARGQTDVAPPAGSPDYYQLNAWRPGAAVPDFSFAFRLARAVRVIPVNAASQQHATDQFDQVVQRIEACVGTEAAAGNIIAHWAACGDDDTCAACDFRYFCPNPAPRGAAHIVISPSAP
jgi:hypothetical protein